MAVFKILSVVFFFFWSCLFCASSLPVAAGLMETCIDDVLRAPVVPPVTAAEEVGACTSYATTSAAAEDPVSLTGEL